MDKDNDYQHDRLPGRRLIRPNLSPYKLKRPGRPVYRRKTPPPDVTNQEDMYIASVKEARNTLVIKLRGGEEVQGWIEYYDRDCIKIRRDNPPHLLIRKDSIVYMYEEKASEEAKKKRK
jgi:sRNA-binding regulator protein Hfq